MIKVSFGMSKQGRRRKARHGIVICDRLPGRFPDAVEYTPAYRSSTRKKAADQGNAAPDRPTIWTCV